MKKILCIMLSMLLCICLSISGCALEPLPEKTDVEDDRGIGVWECRFDENGQLYLFNETLNRGITSAYEVMEDGSLREQDLREYCEVLNAQKPEEQYSKESRAAMQSPRITTVDYLYKEKTRDLGVVGAGLVVSSDVAAQYGDAQITILEGTTITHSFGGSVSFTAKIKEAISGGASFTWNTSLTSAVSASSTMTVKQGTIGHVEFKPYYDVTKGTLTEFIGTEYGTQTNTYEVTGKCPQKTSEGFARGLYQVVTVGTV